MCRNNACLPWLCGEKALLKGYVFPCEETRSLWETENKFHPLHKSKFLPSTRAKVEGGDESSGYCRGVTEK